MAKVKKKGWSYSAGEWGRNRVRAFEQDGRLYLEWYEGSKRKRECLPYSDKARAKQAADKTAAEFTTIVAAKPDKAEPLTLRTLFDMYVREKTPDKGEVKQQHDRSCADMFLRFYGADKEPRTLARQDWDRFIRERREGRIVPLLRTSNRGKRPADGKPRKVRNRVIEYDLKCLIAVLNWATIAGDGKGGYLLERNPFKGFPLPKEKSPTRAIVTAEEYAKLLEAARALSWRHEVMLVLAHETGHRSGAVRQLRWNDVDLSAGLVRWRAENDKGEAEHATRLTPAALEALQKARSESESIGEGWVFPGPKDPGQPCSKDFVDKWWPEMERKAGIEHRKGLGFHSLRRKFATDLKGHDIRDVMALGGWKSDVVVRTCYQAAPDPDRQLAILLSRSKVS